MLDVVVVGAGQAGLAASQKLTLAGIEHLVLERGQVGETWRTQRWDSFALNTPGEYSRLPGDGEGAGPGDGFALRDDFVAYLDRYARRVAVPVETGVSVSAVTAAPDGTFLVHVSGREPMRARAVVIAAGVQRLPRIPPFAAGLPRDVMQLHSTAYRRPEDLPQGAVLVVGSAQSGVQIAEDLLAAGRRVHLSTSRVARFRRRYRGRDIFSWLVDVGFFDQTVAQLPDPALQFAPQPVISGTGPFGHTVSLQTLEQRGVSLLGRAEGIRDGRLLFRDDLGANIAWGDERSADVVRMIEGAIAARGMEAAAIEPDPADEPHPRAAAVHSPESLDFVAAGIATVIWTTGVTGDTSFLPADALGPDGHPVHAGGISVLPGLYLLGIPWLRSRSSGIIRGADADAGFIVQHIRTTLAA